MILLTSSPYRCGTPTTACRHIRQHRTLHSVACHGTPLHTTPHYTTTLSLTTPCPTTRPRLSTNLNNDINIPIPDSPSLPIPRPTTRAPATRTRTNLFPFILDGPGMSLHFPRLHLAPYPSRSETKLCYLEPRALRGRRHRRRQETGPTHVACLFFSKSLVLRQVDSWLSAVLFSGLLTSSKNSTELSAIPPTSQSGGV